MDTNGQDKKINGENLTKNNVGNNGKGGGTSFMFALRLVVIGVVLYVGLNHIDIFWKGLRWVYDVFEPLLIGALLALVLNTPMCSLERVLNKLGEKLKLKPAKRAAELVALTLTFLITFFVFYVVGDIVIPQLVESCKSMFLTIQDNMPEFMKLLDDLEGRGVNTAPLEKWLNEIDINEIIKKITDNALNIINKVLSSATTIITGLFKAISAVVFAIYILANKKKLAIQIKKLAYAYVKKSTVDQASEIGSMSARTFSDFISGQCLDAFILGVLMFISMSIFRFPYPLAISTLITVTALIPYIGSFLGGSFGVLLMIMDAPLRALLFVVLFIVVQQIDNHLIYPRVVGGSVGLPAIWTFAAVIIGGGIFGVLGMVLFIPLFSVFYTILRANVSRRLELRRISIEDSVKCDDDNEVSDKSDFEGFEFINKIKARIHKKDKTEEDSDEK